MTASSADPDALQSFLDGAAHARWQVQCERDGVAAVHDAVRRSSPDFGVDAPILTSLASWLVSLGDNERFVDTVRRELIAADRYDDRYDGRPPVRSDAQIERALGAAGVAAPVELEFAPTTLYGLPPTSGFVDDPICAANGNMVHCEVDLVFPGVAAALDVRRTYNSLAGGRHGVFGPGWSSVLDARLAVRPDGVDVLLPDGGTARFVGVEGAWRSAGRRARRLEQLASGWRVAIDDVRRLRFDSSGGLTGWDVGTARVEVRRDGDRIVGVTETVSGRRYSVEWNDASGAIASITAGDGRWVRYERDGDGRLRRASSASGHVDYDWDSAGRLVAVVDADGVPLFRNEYDDVGRVVRQTSPFGRISGYRYGDDGLTAITDGRGTRQAMVHDRRGNLTAVIDVDGSAMRLAYDSADRVVAVTDRGGATWRYRYDDADRLVQRVDPDGGTERWAWDDAGRVTIHTRRDGAVSTFEYRGGLRHPVRIVGPGEAVTTIEVDERFDRPLAIVDPDGVELRVEHDGDGQPVAAVDALGARTTFAYDAAGRLTEHRDATGVATTIDHDAAGRIVRHARGGAVTTYRRTAAGRIAGGCEPGGSAWSAEFGAHGMPVAISDHDGTTLRLEYDEVGNAVAVVAPDGARYVQRFDETGRLTGVIDPSGGVTELAYDRAGRVVEITSPAGRRLRREVDGFGRTQQATAPDGACTAFEYQLDGDLASVTLPDGRSWRVEHDGHGRSVALIAPDGGRTEFEYSPGGRLLSRRSPAGRVTRYDHDAAGRLAAIAGPVGGRHRIRRDAAGRIVEAGSTESTETIELDRDECGRLLGWRTPSASRALELDPAGRVRSVSDGTGVRSTFEWDQRGLLVAATDPSGGRVDYQYDACGRLAAMTAPGGRTSIWIRDASGRITTSVDPGAVRTEIDHDPDGFVTSLRRGSDGWRAELDPAGRPLALTTLAGEVLGTYRYDAAGRLVEASVPRQRATHWRWDPADRLVEVIDHRGTTTVERDPDGHASALVAADGSRTCVARPLGRGDTLRHDAEGRLLEAACGTVFRYDAAGRLAQVVPPGGEPVAFGYGADGLLTEERRGGAIRRYTHDAAGRVTATRASGGTWTRYEYDDAGRRVRDVRSDRSERRYRWMGLDQLAAVVDVSADGERVVTSIDSDALGRPCRIGDRTVEHDQLTGEAHATFGALIVLGRRVLDRSSHQFLTPDPLLAVPGTNGCASAYTYASNDPVNHVDPSGLRPISQAEWDAIREREERGRLGLAWDAVEADPWGSIAAGAVITTGAVLCATPLAPVGAGIVIGAGVSTGAGLASGALDPRQVALSGVAGGFGGGLGTLGLGVGTSVGAGVVTGGASELGSQVVDGRPIDGWSVAVSAAVGGLTNGIGLRLGVEPGPSGRRLALVGAGTDASGSLAEQALTGDHSVDLILVALEAAGGAAGTATGGPDTADLPFRRWATLDADPVPAITSIGSRQPLASRALIDLHRHGDDPLLFEIRRETGLATLGGFGRPTTAAPVEFHPSANGTEVGAWS